jgi:hypothetical protein
MPPVPCHVLKPGFSLWLAGVRRGCIRHLAEKGYHIVCWEENYAMMLAERVSARSLRTFFDNLDYS